MFNAKENISNFKKNHFTKPYLIIVIWIKFISLKLDAFSIEKKSTKMLFAVSSVAAVVINMSAKRDYRYNRNGIPFIDSVSA